MSSRSQRPVGKFAVATMFYLLALGSGVMRTFSVVFDIVAANASEIDVLTNGFLAQWTSFTVT